MTVAASAGYRKDYTGNGVTVDWPVPFYFLDASHLRVILTNLTTLSSVDLVLGSDFTASGAGSPSGGSITTTVAYSSNYRITVLRNVPLEQQSHYVEGDPFPASSHEGALDKLTMMVQQIAEIINRAIVGAPGSTATFNLPLPQAGMALGWDATATFLVNVANSAVAFAAQLGDSAVAANGAGMVGHGSGLSYGASSVGGKLNPLVERYTTAGTAPTYTVTPSTPWASYTNSAATLRIVAHATGTGAQPTLNVSGLGAKNWMKKQPDGSMAQEFPVSGVEYLVQYDGAQMVTVATYMAAPMGLRNLLKNANGLVNQDGYVSGTATSGAGQYTLDLWRVVVSGQNLTFSTTNGLTTLTAPAGGVEQVIEGKDIIGGTYVLNWTGTAAATVGGGAVYKGVPFTLVGGTNVPVRFSGGTFSLAQLEAGSTPTSFEQRPIALETALCQRYYWKTTAAIVAYGYAGGGGNYGAMVIPFPTTMRVAPTVSQSLSGNTNVSAAVITNIGLTHAWWPITAASTGSFAITLNAGTSFDARL